LKSSPLPPDLADPLNRAADRLGRFGRQVLYYETVASTNDVAGALAEGGAPEGCVVVGETQSAGRGRLGRTWVSPPRAGLYVSTILRPDANVVPLVTIAAGVAIARGIETATGLRADLKWPNDLALGGRKVAGILAEGTLRHVILGFGINVMAVAYPPDVATRATSLETERGATADRGWLLVECLSALSAEYAKLRDSHEAEVLGEWRSRAARTLGRRVRWNAADANPVEGVAEDIDDGGALLVRTHDGVTRVISGEVTWL
jgi:BirA family transcriptional regulator, biotin operon repressor / biotin---[acetyl-CoA-carboxylase] ligase